MKIFTKVWHYIMFIRPLAFIGMFTTFICASLIAISTPPYTAYNWLHILIGAFSCGLLVSATHAINNIYDLEIDKINKPYRALPSKKMSLSEAWSITIFFYILSFILAISINWSFFIIFLVMSSFTILYSCPPFNLKRKGIFANIAIAIPRGLLIVIAGWSVIKSVFHFLPWYIGFISFLFLAGAVTTKDFADIEGDKKNNCITLPVKYGIKKSIKLIRPFFIFPFLLIPLGVYLNILRATTLPLTLLLFYGIFIIWLMEKKPNKLTRIERNHISWKHTYILYMVLQIGMGIAYVV